MDTKWKKWKIVLSWSAFVLSITLLIYSFTSLTELMLESGEPGQLWNGDYQERGAFRWYISDKLEELLKVAAGDENLNWYEPTVIEDTYYMDSWEANDWETDYWEETQENFYTDSAITMVEDEGLLEGLEALYEFYESDEMDDLSVPGLDDIMGSLERLLNGQMSARERELLKEKLTSLNNLLKGLKGQEELQSKINDLCTLLDKEEELNQLTELLAENRKEKVDAYMARMGQDKNLRYAVVYQGNLIYTNIDAYADMEGKAWDKSDFYKQLPADMYNFSLWLNRKGDGKTEITKDEEAVEVYGNDIYYREDSPWYVPGYENFKVEGNAKDVVIFMAVAEEPVLYVVGDYSENGNREYGNYLYWLYQNTLKQKKQLDNNLILLAVAVLLLGIALLWRKEKRLGDQEAARFLGKISLEIKILIWAVLLIIVFFVIGKGGLTGVLYRIILNLPEWYDNGYGYADIWYTLEGILSNRIFLISCFWVIYLGVLDIRLNKGKQKKPLIDQLQMKELQHPLQKRLVRQYNRMMISGIAALVLGVLAVIMVNVAFGHAPYPLDFLTGAGFWIGLLSLISIFSLIASIAITIVNWKKNSQIAKDIGALTDQIFAVREGNLSKPLKLPEDAELRQAVDSLNEIQHGLEVALREQMQSERMKVDLVTNVSHDIKTPLTSIVSYVELLKQEDNLPEHVEEFVRILDEKSERLNSIVQDVFEISKATSGQLPITMEELDYGKLLRQTLADMNVQIEESGFVIKTSIPEASVMIRADGQRLYRVFQNLIQNALKYSLPGSRIYLTLTESEAEATVCIKNTSGMELSDSFDFTERFVRGDESRTDGGSGLGLSIAKSFTEACGGSLRVEVDADLFTVVVAFPKL